MKKTLLVVAGLFVLASCGKDDPEPAKPQPVPELPKASVVLDFHNVVSTEDLVFGKDYLSPAGDSFQVSKFNYYISNITFVGDGNVSYAQPESYFVVRHPSATKITVKHVPPGTYNAVRLMIGVDSTRNTSGAQTGGLDVSVNGDMFWSWNSGYIFMKIEGTSPQSGAASNALTYHIGGFKSPDKTQREVMIPLAGTPLVITENAATVRLKADLNSVFTGPHDISFADFNYQMQPGPGAKKLADNYADMLSLEKVSN